MNKRVDETKDWQKAKEDADRLLLRIEVALASLSIVVFLAIFFVAIYFIEYLNMDLWATILLIIDFVLLVGSGTICALIEQKAGYYKCSKCENKYVPTFNQSMWTPHVCRTKYMKCPHCHKRSWNKKVIK